jgi:hypothetical protein
MLTVHRYVTATNAQSSVHFVSFDYQSYVCITFSAFISHVIFWNKTGFVERHLPSLHVPQETDFMQLL